MEFHCIIIQDLKFVDDSNLSLIWGSIISIPGSNTSYRVFINVKICSWWSEDGWRHMYHVVAEKIQQFWVAEFGFCTY